jgi:hypothetical protein
MLHPALTVMDWPDLMVSGDGSDRVDEPGVVA